MSAANYTPETYEVKGAWGHWSQSPDADAEFDRWLDSRDKEREAALRTQIAADMRKGCHYLPLDGEQCIDCENAARIAEKGLDQ